ncbi:hypothetical protein ONZ43_g6464 [Nemania bipapillata]|uniref:Uncharacterized protein n=1 Tax=Nemania bipapillata TaxID=110536 RepID=A0ACC2HZD8_9PEZI|nr:hypothetical protein ONZ43_g6464 [Nemania bipapillata]
MYGTKLFFIIATLTGASSAQTVPHSVCVASRQNFNTEGPSLPPALSPYANSLVGAAAATDPTATAMPPPDPLGDPEYYISLLCGIAAELPSSVLPDFYSWGSGLLSFGSVHITEFDAYVTDCVTTGEAATTIISSLNYLLTGTSNLCQPTAAPGGSSSGTISTGAPTATGTNSTSSTPVSSVTFVVTAAAARATGVFAGVVAIGGLIGAAGIL